MLETLTVIIALIAAFMCFVGVVYTMLQAVSAVKKEDIEKLEKSRREDTARLEANRREDTARLEANRREDTARLEKSISDLNNKFDTYLFGERAKTDNDDK